MIDISKARPDDYIIMTKWIALEGTVEILKMCGEKLRCLPDNILSEAREFERYLSVEREILVARDLGVSAICEAGFGGAFGALWNLAKNSGVGLEIELKKIPIRQETVEICELVSVNPYKLLSGGSVVMAAEGADLIKALKENDIQATVIGKATAGNARVIKDGVRTMFIEPPRSDEIFKLKDKF